MSIETSLYISVPRQRHELPVSLAFPFTNMDYAPKRRETGTNCDGGMDGKLRWELVNNSIFDVR